MMNRTTTPTTSVANGILWWLCLCIAPAVLVAIELFHPAGFTRTPGMWEYLSKPQPHTPAHAALQYFGPTWWFTLHMIQTPMVGLVCIGLWVMIKDINVVDHVPAGVFAGLSRIATFVTIIYFTALDSIGGFGLGRYILTTQELAAAGKLSQEQLSGVITLLNTVWVDPWVGGVGSFTSQTASWAVFFAALFAALALFLARRTPVVPLVIFVVVFGWQLQLTHAALHGPLAFAGLIISAGWFWFRGGIEPGTSGLRWL
jgi:hypothetical protein